MKIEENQYECASRGKQHMKSNNIEDSITC